MMDIRRNCFLHFLDRELLETQGSYKRIVQASISRDVRLILFSSISNLIISASFLFESIYAEKVFEEFKVLFADGIFVTAITYDSFNRMVSTKQAQYEGKESLFPHYFDESMYHFIESGMVAVPKRQDTTIYIANNMIEQIPGICSIEASNVPYYIDAIENRNALAITHHLFESTFSNRTASKSERYHITDLINESYIRSYMEYFEAFIPTSLTCGIYEYDYLSHNYLFSSVALWLGIYRQIGVYRFIQKCNASEISAAITSTAHHDFISTITSIINHVSVEPSLPKSPTFYIIKSKLPLLAEIEEYDADAYISRISQVLEIISSSHRELVYMTSNEKLRTVFVVHGRNLEAKRSMFDFLRALGLRPLEWEQAVSFTQSGAPTTFDVIKAGMAHSGCVVLLFTGDDEARLRLELRGNGDSDALEPQPRQNVLIEAGYAFALYPNNTIIVKIGNQRDISDLSGFNRIDMDNSAEKRKNFINRLKTCGLIVDDTGVDWITAGSF